MTCMSEKPAVTLHYPAHGLGNLLPLCGQKTQKSGGEMHLGWEWMRIERQCLCFYKEVHNGKLRSGHALILLSLLAETE